MKNRCQVFEKSIGLYIIVLITLFYSCAEDKGNYDYKAVNEVIVTGVTDNSTEALLKRKINFIGAEVLFKTEDAQTAQQEYIADMHKKGLLLWANAIVYNYKAVLTGGHSDDVSLTKNPDDGWGWLADRGYDIIQTDWTLAAKLYLDENNKRFRS